MSSKIRQDDLPIENLDDMDEILITGSDPQRQTRPARQKRKREMINDYMEERSLKRQLSESYELC